MGGALTGGSTMGLEDIMPAHAANYFILHTILPPAPLHILKNEAL